MWRKVVEKVDLRFVSNPSNQSCVDAKKSGLQHAMKFCKDDNLRVGGNMAQLIACLIAADVQQ